MAAWLAILALIVAAIALIVTNDAGTIAGMSNDAFARAVQAFAVLVLIGGAVISAYRGRFFHAVKHLAIWTFALFGLVTLYAFRGELAVVADRVLGELSPLGTQINVAGPPGVTHAVQIKRGWSGHFVAKAWIGDQQIEMIVDTGASTVVLKHDDAKRLGLIRGNKRLSYTVPVQTANGSSYAARVQLPAITVGNVSISGVEALVAKPGSLHQSLLGMSFLSRLRSYEFSGDYLELRG